MFDIKHPIVTSPYKVLVEEHVFDKKNNNIPFFAFELSEQPDMLNAFRAHNHYFPEFILITEGHLFASLNNGEIMEFSKGEMLCVSPYDLHMGYVRKNEKTSYVCLQFDLALLSRSPAELKQMTEELRRCRSKFITKINADKTNELEALICSIRSSLPIKNLYGYMNIIADIHRFMAYILCEIGLVQNSVSCDADFILKVNTYVSEHFGEALSTNKIAAALGIEKKYFCRLFKENFGSTFIDHLNLMRINKAVNMIQYGAGTLTEISRAVGFSDYHYFCRCFTRYIGKPPTAFTRGK